MVICSVPALKLYPFLGALYEICTDAHSSALSATLCVSQSAFGAVIPADRCALPSRQSLTALPDSPLHRNEPEFYFISIHLTINSSRPRDPDAQRASTEECVVTFSPTAAGSRPTQHSTHSAHPCPEPMRSRLTSFYEYGYFQIHYCDFTLGHCEIWAGQHQ